MCFNESKRFINSCPKSTLAHSFLVLLFDKEGAWGV